jgi:hypothetical protein
VLQLAGVFHSPPLAGPVQTAVVCAWAAAQAVMDRTAKSHAALKFFDVCITMMGVLFRLNDLAQILSNLTHSYK